MSKDIIFLSFAEEDRTALLNIRLRALNTYFPGYDFLTNNPLKYWHCENVDEDQMKHKISKTMKHTSKTIVFVGKETHKSQWVPHEIKMSLELGKPVYAMKLDDTVKDIPKSLSENNIEVYNWSDDKLQELATM